jgi:hypothetical protein
MIALSLPLPIAVLALLQAPAGVRDQGVLVVRRDSQVVGRETFRVLDRGGLGGWAVDATARWAGPPALTLSPSIQVAADTAPESLTFGVAAGAGTERITGAPGLGRFTLRYAAPGMERAREVAARPPLVIVDDSVFSLYLTAAWFAAGRAAPRTISALWPRTAASAPLTVRDLGMTATVLNRDPATLHQYRVEGDPGGPVLVWLDATGRLMKVERPERNLRAERAPE